MLNKAHIYLVLGWTFVLILFGLNIALWAHLV